jgi:transcriptional regulator with XRE-family HTH domain
MNAQDRAAMERLGKRLREERVAQDWSQRTFCAAADIDRAFLSRLERGLENVSVITLLKLTRFLKIRLRDITRDI